MKNKNKVFKAIYLADYVPDVMKRIEGSLLDNKAIIDFDINVIKELFSSAIDKCKTTENFYFARGAIRNTFLDPDIEGELLSRIPDDLVALDKNN